MKPFDVQKTNPDPIIAETATLLQEFTEQFQAGELTEAEYKELALDLVDMQRIDEMMMELNRKVEIAKAFQQFLQIVSVITSFK
jgi:hypothetical protein